MAMPLVIEWLGGSERVLFTTYPLWDGEHKIPATARKWREVGGEWHGLNDIPRDWWATLLAGETDAAKEYWRSVLRAGAA